MKMRQRKKVSNRKQHLLSCGQTWESWPQWMKRQAVLVWLGGEQYAK